MLDCEKYNPGEALAKEWLIQNGDKVIDVSKDEVFFDDDIDFIVEHNGREISVEVKWDKYIPRYRTMFVEIKDNEQKGTQGWIYKSRAEYLFYADVINRKIFVMKMDAVREYIKKHKCPMKRTYKDGYKTSLGYIVSVDEMKKEYTVKELSFLNKV